MANSFRYFGIDFILDFICIRIVIQIEEWITIQLYVQNNMKYEWIY